MRKQRYGFDSLHGSGGISESNPSRKLNVFLCVFFLYLTQSRQDAKAPRPIQEALE